MSGKLRVSGGSRLLSPSGNTTRPTTAKVREALMNILQKKLIGAHWLDLFSGSGAIGCEALQRGSQRVVAVERNKKAAFICRENLLNTAIKLSNEKYVEVIQGDAIKWLQKGWNSYKEKCSSNLEAQRFDLIYLDPPYDCDIYPLVLENLLQGQWIKKNSIVICEYSPLKTPNVPKEWKEEKSRFYGKSALLLISPPKEYSVDTDSMPPQKDLRVLPESAQERFHKEEVQSFSRKS